MFFSEIIDLGHPLYDGMPCHAAYITSFYTVDSFAKTRKMSDGRMGLENKMMLLSEHTGTHLDPYNSPFWRSLALPWGGLLTTATGALAHAGVEAVVNRAATASIRRHRILLHRPLMLSA